MGDKVALTKVRMELEDMYQGIPDESVNLTFQDFAELKLNKISSSSGKNKKPPPLGFEPISEFKSPSPLTKLPSLDFNKALQASKHHHINENDAVLGPYAGSRGGYNHHDYHHTVINTHHGHAVRGHNAHNLSHNDHHGHATCGYSHDDHHHNRDHNNYHGCSHDGHDLYNLDHNNHNSHGNHAMNNHHPMDMTSPGPICGGGGMRHGLETSLGAYDHDVSVSMASSAMYNQQERGGRRRPGVPHSNICTICSTYIYIFRHRCLVCGRVYCRQCVMVEMGEMTEGRKCVECLGRRFSQRYIQRAGKVGCFSRYSSSVKQAELKWAEKGPRRSGNGAYGRSTVWSPRSKSPVNPMTPRTPNRAQNTSSPNSFVMNSSSYSPYTPSNHHLPF